MSSQNISNLTSGDEKKLSINRLPEDVFVQVLMAAKTCPLGLGGPSCTLVLCMISQVCSRWRGICTSNPLLWNCIHVESFPLSKFVAQCLIRASDVPISLNITPLSDRHKLTIDTWKHLLRSLATRGAGTERWKALDLRASDYDVFPHLLEYLGSHTTPNLEFISCTTRTRDAYAESHPSRRSASGSSNPSTSLSPSLPNLRSLELKSIHLSHLFNRHPPVMLTRLTCLNLDQAGLDHYTPDALVLLLSSNPRLEELSMTEYIICADNNGNPWSIISPVNFSSLHRLKFFVTNLFATMPQIGGLGWVTHFLRSIDAPGLQQLIIISPSAIAGAITEQFIDFISTGCVSNQAVLNKQSSSRKLLYPELRCLNIFFPLPKGPRLHKSEALLAALPSLTHLGIWGEDIAVVDRAPQCSPNLTCLSVKSPILSDPKLGGVLHRRQEAGFPICVVALQEVENASGLPGLPSTVQVKFGHPLQAFGFLDL